MKNLFLLFTTILVATSLIAREPCVYAIDCNKLATLKQQLATSDHQKTLVKDLQQKADQYLTMKPVSVMDKAFTPASGNKHDYMSQAPYFWYDSSKPNGLPYIRKDGVRNPEILKITDRRYIGELEKATSALALAYYMTNEEKYATKAAELLKHWFLAKETKMNPNLEYAQAIPGVNTGRGIGIIETIALSAIADNAGLISGSKAWSKKDEKALKQWYSQYLDWMLTSKNGLDEMEAKNNHGTFYDMQVVHFALFINNKKAALQRLEHSKQRMDEQIDAEGKMPLELERTTALGYSTFNLEAWFRLATLAEHTGTNLWHYKNKEGKGLQDALDWLAPYAVGEKEWTYQQINPYKKDIIYALFVEAAEIYKDDKYRDYATRLKHQVKDPHEAILLKVK